MSADRRRGARRVRHQPRGPLRVVVAAAAALLVAACSTVPSAGPIEEGPVVDAGESAQFIRVIAAPPSVGAGPRQIVQGFLESHASLESDHAIARRYLTPAAAESWDANAATSIYEQSSLELSGDADEITATMDIQGRLRSDGTLDWLDPARRETHEFQLEQIVDGASGIPQWRISDPPPGVLISDVDLRRAYRLHQVHHPSARSSVLVPDGRMLPVVGASLPTALAERVLAGPAEWLAPGVRSSVPPGTGLALGAVPVQDGVAVVELTDQARSATDAQRRDLAAQLTWTLTGVPGISAVQLKVGGEPFEVPGAPELMDRDAWPGRNPDALTTGLLGTATVPYYTLDGESVVRVSESSRTALAIEVPGADGLIDLGVSLDQRTAAAVSGDRDRLWILPLERGASEQQVQGRDLGGPSFDVDGRPWYTERGRVMRLAPDAEPQQVPIRSDTLDSPVELVRLARDGARILIVADGVLHLGVIHDDADGEPVIDSVRRIAVSVSGVRDAAWQDADTLDVLGLAEGPGRQVLRVSVGSGLARPLGAPPAPREVAGAPGTAPLVTTREQQLYVNVGLQWRDQGPARSVTYPG